MNGNLFYDYCSNLHKAVSDIDLDNVQLLAEKLLEVWKDGKQVFLCGNGGSAANALHLANDLIYGVSKEDGIGLKVNALTANNSILTCLANDISYDHIFSQQLKVLGNPGDILIVLSGSGNSSNVIEAVKTAKEKNITSFAVLGYSGGACLELADVSIHFPVSDMQISEDCQLIVGHMLMRWLAANSKK